ncbi:cell wall binding repeat-containing protein [Clostridium sp. DL-VIII]|uniref:N-acetylmuramoyl-L-alanine amidase family protein n=1 Tax=Clostridium sp. DL-VIII TaxID=641107 RepID=UPI00023B06C4|nr:N-acetylmuramoyl-L-alanine amidase family protein [Clostridium sp. DL-VIII]EHJ02094.1 cell wall binding repeat-containing protein [Clostridium sp. DL-VIII]
MIKGKLKITALLVAAASTMSIVPAMASDKLGTKDGTIENAIAFADGKYVYQGYRSDDDDLGIYYNDGEKDKELDDVEDADLNIAYEDKYAFANDGDDQYLIDLTNGDVIDDDTPEDDADSIASKLRTKLKKTDRYGSDLTSDANEIFGDYYDGDDDSVAALPGNKFGDNWYSYKIALSSDADPDGNGVTEEDGKEYLYGFTNDSGKYIDASNIANIYAYSTARGKMIKIEEFSNNPDDKDKDSELLATLLGQPVVLAQDKDYIYTLIKVGITDFSDNAISTGTTTSAAAVVVNNPDFGDKSMTIRTYIQKISKEEDDQKDDAYLPKSVTSYELGNKNNDGTEFDCDDAKDAYEAFEDIIGDPINITQNSVVDKEEGKVKAKFTVVNGQLIGIDADSDKVKAISFNLKKDKVKFDKAVPNDETNSSDEGKFDEDDKVDAYFVEKDDDDDVDIDADYEYGAYDFDIDGNPWVVTDGKIYKFKDNEFNKIYSCDSSLDSINVYDENNLIVWEDDGDIYTTVSEGTKETEAEAGTSTPAIIGWSQTTDGTWNFYDTTGTKVVYNWINVAGNWYFLDANGTMATGWQYINGAWYYLNPVSDGTQGAMKTGWIYDNGYWYYLNSSGAMATGWQYINGSWYYLYQSGAMAANTTIDGYTLSSSGAWI